MPCRLEPERQRGSRTIPTRVGKTGGGQNYPRPQRHLLRGGASMNPLFQTNSFSLREDAANTFT